MPTSLPELPGVVVHRPRLTQLLDGAVSRPVTLLTAPPGWGKTAALRSWLDHRASPGPAAWISLDPADPWGSDMAGRVADIIASTTTAVAEVEPGRLPTGPAESVVVVVVDDVHLGDAATVSSTLDHLVRGGAHMRLILATRDNTALPVPRWRLGDQVTEIGCAELAFTREETAHMLAVHHVTLPTPEADALHARTEGWPAGIRFAALSAASPDPLAAERHDVARYLEAEVLGRLPSRVTDLLVRTSMLDRVCGDLADNLTYNRAEPTGAHPEREPAQADLAFHDLAHHDLAERDLAELSAAGGFVLALGGLPPWYRYHGQFRETLRTRLRRTQTQHQVGQLHARAASWLARHGMPVEAMRHAGASGDRARIASLGQADWSDLALSACHVTTMDRDPNVESSTPGPVAWQDPELAVAYVVDRLGRGDARAADAGLRLMAQYGQSTMAIRALSLARDRLDGDLVGIDGSAAALLELTETDQNANADAVAGTAANASDAANAASAETAPSAANTASTETAAHAVNAASAETSARAGASAAADPRYLRVRAVALAAQAAALLGAGDLDGAADALAEAETIGDRHRLEGSSVDRRKRGGLLRGDVPPGDVPRGDVQRGDVPRGGPPPADPAPGGSALDGPALDGPVCAHRAAAGIRSLLLAVSGDLRGAEFSARTALAVPPCQGYPRDVHCEPAYLALAVVSHEWSRPAEAERFLTLAERAHRLTVEPELAAWTTLIGTWLRGARGDLTGALDILSAGRLAGGAAGVPVRMQAWFAAAEADLRIAHGDTRTARATLTPLLADAAEGTAALSVLLARALLRDGDPHAAARTLPPWSDDEKADTVLSVRLDAGLVDAQVARTLGDRRRAAQTLERVLDLAEPHGFRRPFAKDADGLRDLLADHLECGTAHWSTVTALVGQPRPTGDTATPAGEPMTEREVTVLRYLQSMLSNEEIAAKLFVSVNTVKTHVRHIYRKLDVSHRRDAVRKARELRLL